MSVEASEDPKKESLREDEWKPPLEGGGRKGGGQEYRITPLKLDVNPETGQIN